MLHLPRIMAVASAAARHAEARQTLVAENIANADTPGYRARDIGDFATSFRDAPAGAMRATRPGHLQADAATARVGPFADGGAMSPSGNDVSVEDQMLRGAAVRQNHEMAVTVYATALGVLRTSLGRV